VVDENLIMRKNFIIKKNPFSISIAQKISLLIIFLFFIFLSSFSPFLDDSTKHLSKGLIYFVNQRFTRAEYEFKWLINHEVEKDSAYYFLSQLYLEKGMINEADKMLSQLSGSSKFKFYHYYSALIKMKKGKFEEALEEIEKGIQEEPSEERYYYLKGYIFFLMANFDSAINELKKGIFYNPYNDDALFLLGICYLKKLEIEKAKLVLKRLEETGSEFYSPFRKLLENGK